VPLEVTFPGSDAAILTPNPRVVSNRLLARDRFVPATTLNLLAAAWLQFMVHDWFSHGKNQKENPWRIVLAEGDPWPEPPMTILRTHRDPTRPEHLEGVPPTFANVVTHWWDGSQIYGSDENTLNALRSGVGGRMAIEPNGFLPLDPKLGVDLTGVNGNWWVGLSLLHNLFVREHNAICDRLRAEYPSWSDDDLFDRARLVNAALIAKIHTVDWTTAILGHPTMQYAMRADWWGAGLERVHRILGRIGTSDFEGAPGSATNFYGAPYAMTEEFVAVYRMHPLLPDELSFRSATDDRPITTKSFPEVAFRNARVVLEQVPFADAIYSLGTSNPGAITLHNYPKSLRELREPDGTLNDIATTDILRIRERGVPRYNAFRELFHLPRVESFGNLTDNPTWAQELREVYDNDIDQVDLMVGLYAEPRPQGFGFSDTAFRVFALMAPRRLTSDRFFTIDYNPRVYTPAGFDWVEQNDFTSVLLRHFPALLPALRESANPFSPWTRA
ncbi:MAG TPA: peroxidase family protein, partial [Chloroflexota bacterium]|nr:peroxidase family protein [Chloroflexota bacterium]